MNPRCYTREETCLLLGIPRRSFYHHLKNGSLPMVQELKPRIGRIARYRSGPIDDYLAGDFGRSRFFGSHRRAS